MFVLARRGLQLQPNRFLPVWGALVRVIATLSVAGLSSKQLPLVLSLALIYLAVFSFETVVDSFLCGVH